MKKLLIYVVILLVVVVLPIWQYRQIKKLTAERDRYRANTETLLQDVRHYKTIDSLNAATVGVLELKLSEYEKYRADDAALIRTLQVKNRDLQSVTTAQLETINELRGSFRDSTVIIPGEDRIDTVVLSCIDIIDPWYEMHGCVDPSGEFTGTMEYRDSILIAATVKYKRFLGFLWKTRKVKNRQIDAVSRNTNTHILGVEYIEIEN